MFPLRRLLLQSGVNPSVSVVPSRSHTGYMPFEGRVGPNTESDLHRFNDEVKRVNLQPVKRVHFKFDPFRPNVRGIRVLMTRFSYKKVRATNHKCLFKTDVLSDGSDPLVKVELNNGKNLTFKAGTLSEYDMLYHFNRIVLPLVEDTEAPAKETKATKKKK